MILHLGDDEKVINRAFASFEHAFPNKNYILQVVPDLDPEKRVKECCTNVCIWDN